MTNIEKSAAAIEVLEEASRVIAEHPESRMVLILETPDYTNIISATPDKRYALRMVQDAYEQCIITMHQERTTN